MARRREIPDVLYRLYGRRLAQVVRDGPLPHHVGVILDGNRRFARARGASAADGHRMGAEKIPQLLDWCAELGISYVSLFLLSTDNLNRDSEELSELVTIIGDSVRGLVVQRHRWPGICITGLGAPRAIPEELREVLEDAAEVTAAGKGLRLQIAVGYGGRQEIMDALRTHLADRASAGASLDEVIADLDVDHITANLYAAGTPDPDLIIRTSGEIRLSGFLMWQSAHSEFYFCDPYWPEFRHIDFLRALREFQQRHRRFGR
jgi:short-chain Z-isoprenyl diphosphate synthase